MVALNPDKAVRPPEILAAHHDLESFDNGQHPTLDRWLRETARKSEGLSARTYVVCAADRPERVVGYFAISTAMAHRGALPSAKLRRDMPNDVPLLLIGRLAVDKDYQGLGLGSALLADALARCESAAEIAGARGVIAHAIDEAALGFYLKYGFTHAPELGERVVLLSIETIRRARPHTPAP